jgi:hypothetical protein
VADSGALGSRERERVPDADLRVVLGPVELPTLPEVVPDDPPVVPPVVDPPEAPPVVPVVPVVPGVPVVPVVPVVVVPEAPLALADSVPATTTAPPVTAIEPP